MACVNCGKPTERGSYICGRCVEDMHFQNRLGASLARGPSILNEIDYGGVAALSADTPASQEFAELLDDWASEETYPEALNVNIEEITESTGGKLLNGYIGMLVNIGIPVDIEKGSLPLITNRDLILAEKIWKNTEGIEGKYPNLSNLDLYLLMGSLFYILSRPDSGAMTVADRGHHLAKAGEYYDKALVIDQGSAAAWKNKAKLLLERGEYGEAIECYDWIAKNLELPTDDMSTALNKGLALYGSGDFDGALSHFDEVLDNDPGNVEAWRRKGDVFAKTDRWGGAIQCYEEALKHDETREDIWITMGEIFINNEKYKDASRCLDEVLKLNIMNTDAWYLQGIVFSKIGRWGAALQCLDKALSVNPYHIRSWSAKAGLLADTEQYDEALDCYDKGLRLQPDDTELVLSKVKILRSLKRDNESLQTLEDSIAVNDENADLWYEMGIILQETGKAYKALKSLDKALGLNSSLHEAYYKKGKTLEELRRYREAIQSYEKVLELDPKFEKALRAKKECQIKIEGK
jgi:tetratricopeptide (TPR) repeat protein